MIYVSNHSSWVDVPVIGGVLDGRFVAKGEVAGWPIISTIARLGPDGVRLTQPSLHRKERDAMRGGLQAGDNLILFPEGTSSDGSRVLPFRTSFFAVAEVRRGRAIGRSCRSFSQCRWCMTGWVGCRQDVPAGRCSRGMAIWISRRISGG